PNPYFHGRPAVARVGLTPADRYCPRFGAPRSGGRVACRLRTAKQASGGAQRRLRPGASDVPHCLGGRKCERSPVAERLPESAPGDQSAPCSLHLAFFKTTP